MELTSSALSGSGILSFVVVANGRDLSRLVVVVRLMVVAGLEKIYLVEMMVGRRGI